MPYVVTEGCINCKHTDCVAVCPADAFREGAMKDMYYRILTKKPVTATELESDRNPRSRSAKLRAAEKI